MLNTELNDMLKNVNLNVDFQKGEDNTVIAILERFGFETVASSRYAAVELLTQEFEEYAEKFLKNQLFKEDENHKSDLVFVLKVLLDRDFIKEQNL